MTNDQTVTQAAQMPLAECPIGLFLCGRELCLKTEYGNNEGRIDAYIVSSGEFFWGDAPQTIASQRAQLVTPVDADDLLARHRTAHSGEGGGAPTQRMEKTLGAKFVASGEGRSNGAGEDVERLVRIFRSLPLHGDAGCDKLTDDEWRQVALAALTDISLSAPQGEVERLREALEPFAWLAGPINGEEGRPSYLEVISGPNGTDELKLSTYVGDGDRIALLDAADFRRARAALAQPEAGGERE